MNDTIKIKDKNDKVQTIPIRDVITIEQDGEICTIYYANKKVSTNLNFVEIDNLLLSAKWSNNHKN